VFHWEVLIIPAIALVVWILTTLFRGGENAQMPPRREGDEFAPKRPATSLDRTLEEARRRRQQPVRRPTLRPEVRRPVLLEEVKEPPRPPAPAKPIVLQLAEPEPPRPQPRAEFAPPPPPSAPAAAPPARVAEVPQVATQPASPVVSQVRQLLRSPRSAAAAFVLREVLGAPRCRRRLS
jgi:hypothetical protein